MRATLGAGLLLVSAMLVGVSVTPADAATGCDNPDTTWVGPATPDASASWNEPSNWSGGVPTAASTVCIPNTAAGPRVTGGTQAQAGTVALNGSLTVETSVEVGSLIADGGRLVGGSTTVTESITGDGLTLEEGASLDGWGVAVFGEWDALGSRITVHGDAVMAPSGRIDTLDGLFTIADTGSLTMDATGSSAVVVGGFANHGAVTVPAGSLFMMGAGGPGSGQPDEFSDGTFTAASDAELSVAYTELRTGARLDHLAWVDHITVPAGERATIADSTVYWDPAEPEPNLAGAGELVVTDNAIVGGRIAGGLQMTVPGGEVVKMGDAVVQDHVQIRIDGELAQVGDVDLNDDAMLYVHGVHSGSGKVDFTGTDPGLEIIYGDGELVSEAGDFLGIYTPAENYGTVDSGSGFIDFAPTAQAPVRSWGTFRADPAGDLRLGDGWGSHSVLDLGGATIEGEVDVAGPVRAEGLEVRGDVKTLPPAGGYEGGHLVVGTLELFDGASVTGDGVVIGEVDSRPGPTGTASLSGAEVTGEVYAWSGTLSVPSLAPSTLTEDGTLVQGRWIALEGATIDLPAITTNDAWLELGRGASFGGGLANMTGNGPNGNLLLGDDLSVPGRFRNEGVLGLSPRSLLDVGGKFRQLATATLVTRLDATGLGRLRAGGPRDLAGALVVDRDPAYKPPIGTVLNVITSAGAASADDAFDNVGYRSRRYGTTRKLQVTYDANHVRVRVERIG